MVLEVISTKPSECKYENTKICFRVIVFMLFKLSIFTNSDELINKP